MIELGLQRISRLLAQTPLPWRAIHVAGTNGKGSICAYVSSMLDTYNRSTARSKLGLPTLSHGRFTSPHLIDRWDCITIDQRSIDRRAFEAVEQRVLERNRQDDIKASEFEVLAATAFEIFTDQKVDIGVVEVGMGGRLDATNILGQPVVDLDASFADVSPFRPPPLVTAIAKIGLDHQAFLGNTLEAIAAEKAGIIKPGVPVVYDHSNERSVQQVFEQAAKGPIVTLANLHFLLEMLDDESLLRWLPEEELTFRDVHPSSDAKNLCSLPPHNKRNMSVAFRSTWTALHDLVGLPSLEHEVVQRDMDGGVALQYLGRLVHDMLSNAASNAAVPGRLTWISTEQLTRWKSQVLLDGAHNTQSATVLAEEVNKLRARTSGAPCTWVLAFSSTKDIREMLQILLKPGDRVFAAEFGPVDGMPWVEPMGAEKIVAAVKSIFGERRAVDATACGRDVSGALQAAANFAEKGTMILAGSLYLVSDVMRLLRDAEGSTV